VEVCAVFEIFRRKFLRDEYKVASICRERNREEEGWNAYLFNRALFRWAS
jgi:hypothetical protein